MVKDHSDTMSKFHAAISLATLSDNIFAPSHREDRAFVTPAMENWLERV